MSMSDAFVTALVGLLALDDENYRLEAQRLVAEWRAGRASLEAYSVLWASLADCPAALVPRYYARIPELGQALRVVQTVRAISREKPDA